MYPDLTTSGRHYAHPLISWSAIIAGALVAIALGAAFNLLGVAIGASAFNAFALDESADPLTVGAALWILFSQLVALQLGAYVAARAARWPDHFGGTLTGILVWSLAVFVALSFALFSANAGAEQAPGAASALSDVASATSAAAEGETAAPAQLADAQEAADRLAGLAWVGVGALGLGFAGAVAGGWLGARHPAWAERPRLDDRAAYGAAPTVQS